MSAQNVTARRGAVIAGVATLVLLIFVAAFDNQWTQNWRAARIGGDAGSGGNSWIAQPVKQLDAMAWRATPLTGEPTRFYIGNLVSAVLAIVLTGLLALLVCRGIASERGRWPLFLGVWLATGLASGLALIAGVAIAGSQFAQLNEGTTYYSLLGSGFEFALFAGWLVGFAAVLVYGSTTGMDDITAASEYSSPSGYDYGSATPASYSYSPTSPYGQSPGGYGSGSANAPTQVVPPAEDPYGGRSY